MKVGVQLFTVIVSEYENLFHCFASGSDYRAGEIRLLLLLVYGMVLFGNELYVEYVGSINCLTVLRVVFHL